MFASFQSPSGLAVCVRVLYAWGTAAPLHQYTTKAYAHEKKPLIEQSTDLEEWSSFREGTK